MERNVVTPETAEKLKAAGFPQTAWFNWYFMPTQWGYKQHLRLSRGSTRQ